MATNFRTEVFKLCKKLQKDEVAQRIGRMIHDMSVVVESKERNKNMIHSHNDLAYIAERSNNEFHGFVFFDDNIEKTEVPIFF